MRIRPLLPFFIVPFLLVTAASLRLGATEKEFDMRLYAPFLEPGLAGQDQKTGDEIAPEGLEWLSPTRGRLLARLWHLKGAMEFETTPDRKAVSAVKVDLGPRGLDVWRHRHSYLKKGDGYAWNDPTEDPTPIDSSLAADYDSALSNLWALWSRRHLDKILQGRALGLSAKDGSGRNSQYDLEEKEYAWLRKKMTMRYDRNGLIGTAWGDFSIRLWHIPVHVRFEVKPHKPTHTNPQIIQLAHDVEYRYDKEEWRRRHGYGIGSYGAYAWNKDFPDPKPKMTSALGTQLDRLMENCAHYWARTAAYIIMGQLDSDLKAAMGRPASTTNFAIK